MRNVAPALVAAAALFAALPACAQDQSEASGDQGQWLFRARAILVAPNESSGAVTGFAGSGVSVSNSVMPEIDFTYLPVKHVGIELILATTKHDLGGKGSLSGLGKLGDTWALPPTLTLQYHFTPDAHVRPYVGAGVNYTIFYSSKTSDSLNKAIGSTDMKLDDSFGYALQAGVDVDITPKVFANLDVKYIDMSTTAHLATGAAKNSVDVKINPIVAGVGIGFRF